MVAMWNRDQLDKFQIHSPKEVVFRHITERLHCKMSLVSKVFKTLKFCELPWRDPVVGVCEVCFRGGYIFFNKKEEREPDHLDIKASSWRLRGLAYLRTLCNRSVIVLFNWNILPKRMATLVESLGRIVGRKDNKCPPESPPSLSKILY